MRAVLSVAVLLCVFTVAQDSPPRTIPSSTLVAPRTEPGERLVLKGMLYDREGRTPLANVTLFVYHTDSTGLYSKPVNDSRRPRLRAWVKTDAQGRFELDTIKPGSYPDGGNPAHIHVVFMEDGREAGGDECWFAGDRFLTPQQNEREQASGKFSRIVRLAKGADGVWRGEWNLRRR